MRLFISFILAIIVSLSIFIGMERMTSSKNMKQMEREDIPQLVYLRDNQDSIVNKKKRINQKNQKYKSLKNQTLNNQR